ncbi:benenodin family lasso peptide [Sphingomonas sp. CL5.1]|nr:benenodin family lasso peptide [Sphingomonas sp. CL5.1]QKS00357.1 benenodin family lasso peptide [Sphingomonas sp. CL5.1]
MDRFEISEDVVDLGDVVELTRGISPVGGDDSGGALRKEFGLTQDD